MEGGGRTGAAQKEWEGNGQVEGVSSALSLLVLVLVFFAAAAAAAAEDAAEDGFYLHCVAFFLCSLSFLFFRSPCTNCLVIFFFRLR
jgi:hypothetical protein